MNYDLVDKIEGISVMVSDQQKAVEFYTQKLRFDVKLDTNIAGYRWIVVGPKNSDTVISLVDSAQLKKNSELKEIKKQESRIGTNTGIWFYAKDINSVYETLKSRGVEITKPEKQPWGVIMSRFYDQDRNEYSLLENPEMIY